MKGSTVKEPAVEVGLAQEIRDLRKEMERLYVQSGSVTPEVLRLSQAIDRRIARYMRITT